MANVLLDIETEECLEARIVHVGEQAIPFERFLDIAEGRFVELVRGVIVENRVYNWITSYVWDGSIRSRASMCRNLNWEKC